MSQQDPKRTWTQEDVAAMVERQCAEQGIPVKVTNPTIIRRVATLLGAPEKKPAPRHKKKR
jgi:hypothetical protein